MKRLNKSPLKAALNKLKTITNTNPFIWLILNFERYKLYQTQTDDKLLFIYLTGIVFPAKIKIKSFINVV